MNIHPKSDVLSKNIGEGTYIWQYSIVLPGAIIGKNCNINAHCFIEDDVKIGDNVTVKCGVYLWNGMTIDDDVFIGPAATFINDKNPRSKSYMDHYVGARLLKGASIGANATIMGGISIGKYAMIGAGSVVTRNVPDYTLWQGNPARQVAFVCDCGYKLKEDLSCSNCNSYFVKDNSNIVKKTI